MSVPEVLLEKARLASQNAYAPYSEFSVGAAIRWRGGHVSTGANVENASYGLTLCAERVAVVTAASEGHREVEEVALWVESDKAASPCGACLQVLVEFCSDPSAVRLTMASRQGARIETLADLMPQPFRLREPDPERA